MSFNAKQDAINRSITIVDPVLDPIVESLCKSHGYGAVMDSAMRQWIIKDPMGAFYIEGCLGRKHEDLVIKEIK